MKQKTVFVFSAIVLLAVFIAAVLFATARKGADDTALPAEKRALLVRPHAPAHGRAEARVELVEFFDPACETCAAFYPMVKALIAKSPDQIRLVLRYAPFHPGSDGVVALLEASRRQNRFWPTLERLFATQARWSPNHAPQMALVWSQLDGLGLDLDQLQRDMADPEVVRRITQDLDDASRLGVTMTPEYFVNGRPLPSFGYEQLEALVRSELAKAGG